ncbi:hypothetical protein FRC08_001765 [Ceratobasidium sp. 394]|nr:hypothetical protein FRC08_001765 [Ceratobasidium sp. 394]
MLVELIEYYKNKYGAAKAMIARLQGEVKTLQQQLEVQQSHQPAAHLPLDQRSIHDSGYSSGNSGGPKRRRVDVESGYYVGQGGGSSPRSIHTPVVSSRFAPSGAGGSTAAEGGGSLASSSTRYGGQPTSHRIASNQSGGQVRSIK